MKTQGEERERWRSASQEELDTFSRQEVFTRLTMKEVMEQGYKPRDAIPAQGVATIKPIGEENSLGFAGRARGKIVCCGNFEHTDTSTNHTAFVAAWCEVLVILNLGAAYYWGITLQYQKENSGYHEGPLQFEVSPKGMDRLQKRTVSNPPHTCTH
eukprot:6491787-Amphidinium_carterae.3